MNAAAWALHHVADATSDTIRISLAGRLCDVYIDDRTVSKFHCLLIKAPDGMLYVRDLGSANGTIVNGRKVTEEAVLHGDEVTFATRRFRLQIGEQLPDVHPQPEYEEDGDLQTLMISPDQNVNPATEASEKPDRPKRADGSAMQQVKMTLEDGQNLGEWLQATGKARDSDEQSSDTPGEESDSQDGNTLTSDSDVEPVVGDSTG